ncbi:unnamed protein product [Orchesella dallaii]|uniref:Ionotropic glutamate receptor C-terminal domain-containing protein n=1 Tax=Orchesella dallaii TaxID=48710 RepID=A0ABP1RA03_9HEXA
MAKLSLIIVVISLYPVEDLEIKLDHTDHSHDYFIIYPNLDTSISVDVALMPENYPDILLGASFGPTNENLDISASFQACYLSKSFFSLILLTNTDKHFERVLKTLFQQAKQLKEVNHQLSYCRVYVTLAWCSSSSTSIFSLLALKGFEPSATATPFDINSDVYLVLHCESSMEVNIMEIYFVKGKFFLQNVTTQKGSFNLANFQVKTKMERRQDLQGLEVVAVGYFNTESKFDDEYEVKLGKTEDSLNETHFQSGLSVSILRDFRTGLNFTETDFKLYFTDNYFIDSFTSKEYQFDLVLVHLGITRGRTEVARPLHPTFFDGFRNIYRKPFKMEMWLFIVFVWTGIFMACKLCLYLENKLQLSHSSEKYLGTVSKVFYYEFTPGKRKSWIYNNSDSFDAFLWCVATVCQQGLYQIPKSFSVRLMLICGLFLSVVCYTAYTGMIVSELWDVKLPIKSLEQLLVFADKIYLLASSDTSAEYLESLNKSRPELGSKLELQDVIEVMPQLIQNPGKSCFLSWIDNVAKFVNEEQFPEQKSEIKNGIDVSSKTIEYVCQTFSSFQFQKLSSMYVPKNSEIEKLFNYRIIIGLERGLIRKYWNEYKQYTNPPCSQTNRQMTPMDIGDVFFAYCIIASAMSISLVLLFLEKLYCWLKLQVQFIQLRIS